MELQNIAEELRLSIRKNGHLPLELRKTRLSELKKCILNEEAAINKALKEDLGKSIFETYATEMGFILEEISHIMGKIDGWAKSRRVGTPISLFPGRSYIQPEPYGVVLIVSPWNYPFQLSLAPFIGAIAAGNRVVLKPSEMAPKTAEILEKIIKQVFKPDEVRVVQGALPETQILLQQKWDYLFFTGSTAVGKVMMKAAAEHLTPVTLELGGKSPCLIEETANLDIAAKRCAWGKFVNAGQTCVAPDYVLVPRKLQDAFIEKMKFHLKVFYGEQPELSDDYPRIINPRHFERLQNLLISEKVAIGGKLNAEKKYISPTVLKDVNWKDKVMEEEIFGPILPLIPYDTLDEALAMINDRPKPLAFYVFTEDSGKGRNIISRVPFGGGCINDTVIHLANPNLPFGGVGSSGIGSYHGHQSFETFTHYKSVFHQGTKVDIPVRYPPYAGKLGILKFFLR
ncbi:MAG TPA: aldehyde dehydrogenase [Bacteriovoracaceae bacterium]|nr:aldehyde dehydrogenase [Bacteriovoracaceae bacterium]